jgi:C4-type Zn-finger protein
VTNPSSIKCPACQSEIGSDGKSLINRSPFLTELEGAADKFEKKLSEIEREREAEKKKDAVQSLEKKPADAGRKSWLKRS